MIPRSILQCAKACVLAAALLLSPAQSAESGAAQPDVVSRPSPAPAAKDVAPLPPLDVMNTEFGVEVQKVVEEFQPAAAKVQGAQNGWPFLLEAAATIERLRRKATPAKPEENEDEEDNEDEDNDEDEEDEEDPPAPDFRIIYDAEFRAKTPAEQHDVIERMTRTLMADAEKAGIFELLAKAKTHPRMVRSRVDAPERAAELKLFDIDEEPEKRLGRAYLSELGSFRNLARLNLARMHDAAGKADWQTFTIVMEENLTLSRASLHQGYMIDRLVGIAIGALTCDQVIEHISRHRLTESQLAALTGVLDRQLATRPDIDLQLRCERLVGLDTVKWSFDDDGVLDLQKLEALFEATFIHIPKSLEITASNAKRDENIANVEELFLRCRQFASLSARERRTADEPDVWLEKNDGPGTMIAGLISPAVAKTCISDDSLSLAISGLRATIAVEIFRAKTGDIPHAWDDVVAKGVLAAPPHDAFSDQPLRYKRLEAPNARGRSYLIYSVGADEEDNDGVEHERVKFWALNSLEKGKGFDYVVNEPR